MRKFLHKILVGFCLIFVVALICAYVSVYINSEINVIPAFCGLAYPYLVLVNLIFVIYWIYRKRWTFLLPLFAILIGWQSFNNYFAFGINKEKVVTSEVKILSYNVRYFNHYNWNKDPKTSHKMLDLIEKENVDIACFQEFLLKGTNSIELSVIKIKLKKLKYVYVNKKRDLAIFSRYRIVNYNEISFEDTSSASAFYVDIHMDNEIVRVFNCHLESTHFNRKDYEFINNISQNNENKNIEGVKSISKSLSLAFRKRAKQANILKVLMQKTNNKIIVCADMNDTPISYVYANVRNSLNDAFVEKGIGIGTTYVGDFPSYRIDYIFHSNDIECTSYVKIKAKHSDHYPIVVGFRKDF